MVMFDELLLFPMILVLTAGTVLCSIILLLQTTQPQRSKATSERRPADRYREDLAA